MDTIKGEFVFVSENVLAVAVHFFACFILDLKKDIISNFNEYYVWQKSAIITSEEWEKITLNKVIYPLDDQDGLLEIITHMINHDETLESQRDEEFGCFQEAQLNPPFTEEQKKMMKAEREAMRLQAFNFDGCTNSEMALQKWHKFINE